MVVNMDTSTTLVQDKASSTKTNTAKRIRLHVCPIAGNQFDIELPETECIDGLKLAIARKLKVSKERINLLVNQNVLSSGTLVDNYLFDGCKITLLPNVESGIASTKSDQSVLHALENLSDSQTKDFLAGRSPLTLMMRMGDHMMFVELQLSTNTPNGRKQTQQKSTLTDSVARSSPSSTSSASPKPSLATDHRKSPPSNHLASHLRHPRSHEKTLPEAFPETGATLAAQASRNISQKLKELSHSEICKKLFSSTKQTHSCHNTTAMSAQSPVPSPGAIIESIYHHGQGVFSGTFSGTLSPTKIQETAASCDGHARKDVHTIIHILNDLLGAAPQYRNTRSMYGSCSSTTPSSPEQSPPPSPSTTEPVPRMSASSSFIHPDNQATRGKMDQLRLMLQERKQRRRTRRERSTPYPTWLQHKTQNEQSSIPESKSTPDNNSYTRTEPIIA